MISAKYIGPALFCVLAGSPALAAEPPGDPAAGREVAKTECESCHVIVDDGKQPADGTEGGAPDFAAIARDPEMTANHIRQLLKLPHGQMNNVLLTSEDIDNVVSYIFTQRPAR
jgi:mono/diheme cytochrome c family protein